VYFLGGQIEFVRMELWARILQNALIGNELGSKYVLQKFYINNKFFNKNFFNTKSARAKGINP
jgi:hypothetical protein